MGRGTQTRRNHALLPKAHRAPVLPQRPPLARPRGARSRQLRTLHRPILRWHHSHHRRHGGRASHRRVAVAIRDYVCHGLEVLVRHLCPDLLVRFRRHPAPLLRAVHSNLSPGLHHQHGRCVYGDIHPPCSLLPRSAPLHRSLAVLVRVADSHGQGLHGRQRHPDRGPRRVLDRKHLPRGASAPGSHLARHVHGHVWAEHHGDVPAAAELHGRQVHRLDQEGI